MNSKEQPSGFCGYSVPLNFGMELDNPYYERSKEKEVKKKPVKKLKRSQITHSSQSKSSITPDKELKSLGDSGESSQNELFRFASTDIRLNSLISCEDPNQIMRSRTDETKPQHNFLDNFIFGNNSQNNSDSQADRSENLPRSYGFTQIEDTVIEDDRENERTPVFNKEPPQVEVVKKPKIKVRKVRPKEKEPQPVDELEEAK